MTLLLGCHGAACNNMSFQSWQTADRIVVRVDSGHVLRTIANKAVISQVSAFAITKDQGWSAPWSGTPVSRITLDFYSGDRFLGHLGIGPSFLETQGCDEFVSRALTVSDRREVTGILGVEEEFTK
jgi:hypothetical protein